MSAFGELSRRERLIRLRRLAHAALDVYGMGSARLRFIQYFENIIYRVDFPGVSEVENHRDAYLPGRFILRIHASRDAGTIASELTWLVALSKEAGMPVPAPVMTPDGRLLATITTPDIPTGRVVSLMRWLDGRRPRQGMRPSQVHALGQVVAQMHAFAASWQPPGGFRRFHWNWEAMMGGSMFRRPLEEVIATIPTKFQHPCAVICAEAKRVMESLGDSPVAYGMIHGDLYPENILFKDGKALPIDFEDCGYGYWMMDIAVALCEWAWGSAWERTRDAFRRGYAQVRTLPEQQWSQLDLFVAAQFATLVLWSSAMLMNDPMRAAEYIPWREKVGNQLLGYFTR